MPASLPQLVEVLAWTAGLSAFLVAWVLAGNRLLTGKPMLPRTPREPVPWGLGEALLVFVAFVGVPLVVDVLVPSVDVARPTAPLATAREAALRVVEQSLDEGARLTEACRRTERAIWVRSLASPVALLLGLILLRVLAGARAADLGFCPRRLGGDVARGALGFVAVAAPMFVMQAALQVLFRPTRHPIIPLLQSQPNVATLVLAAISAVLVAPLVEEFVFRVVLQGSLERFWGHGQSSGPCDEKDRQADFRPIATSALVFALMHAGSGTDPIPLFVFALGLGYLYERTHRIWPCLVMHMLLNATSLAMLWVAVSRDR